MRPLTLTLLCALVVPLASAQSGPLDVRTLDAFFDRDAKVEVNLRGSLLRLAVEATRDSEPEVAEMVDGLNAVTVRIYELQTARGDLSSQLSSIGDRFEDAGWFTFVRVRGDEDDPEDVWIYVREDGDVFGGMAVMAVDHEDGEAAFILIDGVIDPAQVGRLSSRFGGPDLDDDE
ncbi:MAG: hypothetical protein Rubg2KO_16130 [Rubricoccaceae bacterium]